MDLADRDKAENLLLVCANEHDEIDRDGALDLLTVEKLRRIKHDHEDWMRRVTGCSRNRTTVILRMIGQIRGSSVELTRPTTCEAVLRSTDRFPDFPLTFQQQGVEIDLRHVPGEASSEPSYWANACAIIDDVVDHKLSEGVKLGQVEHVSVFAFARLPLLAYLGSKLDDTYEVDIYQRHRADEGWTWPNKDPAIGFEWSLCNETSAPEAVVIMNVSGTIHLDKLPRRLRRLPTYRLSPSTGTPNPDVVNNPESLDGFVATVRGLFSWLETTSKSCRRLHIFAALPIAAAVALGRVHDPHVHPSLLVYYRAATGDYLPALEIE